MVGGFLAAVRPSRPALTSLQHLLNGTPDRRCGEGFRQLHAALRHEGLGLGAEIIPREDNEPPHSGDACCSSAR